MIPKTLKLLPAYGRKYKTQKALKIDFNEGKDFQMDNGSYCSIRDLSILKYDYETVYYNFGSSIIYIIRFGKVQNWIKND